MGWFKQIYMKNTIFMDIIYMPMNKVMVVEKLGTKIKLKNQYICNLKK